MEASARLVAGSHNRNGLVVIHGHEELKPLRSLSRHACEICGDDIGKTADGELFVACNECGFPVCHPCYEYERREGTQHCPQTTVQDQIQATQREPEGGGDEEEEDVDDIEHEFNLEEEEGAMRQHQAEAMLHAKMRYGRGLPADDEDRFSVITNPCFPETPIVGRS